MTSSAIGSTRCPGGRSPDHGVGPATTAVGFVLLGLIGVGTTWTTPMAGRTVLMMVLPWLVVFGLLALALGVKHGEYRAGSR